MDFFSKFDNRLEASKSESDVAYFFDLLMKGEYLTKVIATYLVASINDDKERTRYRYEFNLSRGNSIGEFSRVIDEIVTGPTAQVVVSTIFGLEMQEISSRSQKGQWQYEAQEKLHACLKIFSIQNDLQTKSPLKQWFHSFVHLRNKTRGHGAPTISDCSLACELLNESINLIINNFSGFKRTWAYLHQNVSGKYRISVISSSNMKEFDYLKSEDKHRFETGIYCFIDKPRKIQLFYSNSELSDYFITNGNFKTNEFEAISYVTDTRIYLDGTSLLIPAIQLPASITDGEKKIEVLDNCFTNLPIYTDDYVSRASLEEELKRVLIETDRFPIVTLVGRGGIGKTSLALSVLKAIAKSTRFDLILWFSARDIDLTVDGPKQVQTSVLNQKDISIEFIRLATPTISEKLALETFTQELTKSSFGNALYVFDNFETLSNPIEVFEWINTYIRNPNKVLITSRISREFKADYPIEVSGMTYEESSELIDLYAEKFNIKHLITPNYVEELISESDGHPYIIKVLLGEVSKDKKIAKVERIVSDKDKILSALFKRTFNNLSPSAKRVFLTLCSWNSMVPQIAVEAVLWRPENERIDVSGAIEELRISSFIEVHYSNEQSIISVPLAATIFGRKELEVSAEKIKILEDRKLLMEFGTIDQRNISSAFAQRIEKKFMTVAKRQNNIEGFLLELPSLEYICSRFPKAYLYIIDIFEEFKDFDRVKYYLREYLKNSLTPKEKSALWLRLAEICRFTNDWEGESHAISELAAIPHVEFVQISEAANRINNYFYHHPEAKTVDHKKAFLNKIISVMKARLNEGTAIDYSRLGWLLLSNNELQEAKHIVEKGLELDAYNPHCQKLWSKIQV